MKAAILLGSQGVDLPGIQQTLKSLSTHQGIGVGAGGSSGAGTSAFSPLDPIRDTDISGFLRNERENAILSVIEETRKETFDHVERLHWDAMEQEWEMDKQRILQVNICNQIPI